MFKDTLSFHGEIRLWLYDRFGKLISFLEQKNFIVTVGLEAVVDILEGTNAGHSIYRMAIGDSGSLSGQPFVPKTPDATWPALTGLYHEVARKNIDTPTQPTSTSMTFTTTFQSNVLDKTSFTSSPYYINEACLIISDRTQTGLQQINKTSPDSVDADEKMLSIRTFKSQPFDPDDTLTLSLAWTIYVQ